MKPNFFEKTLNLLYGASFAFSIVGAFSAYFVFYHQPIVVVAFLSFLGALPGVFLYIICEVVFLYIEKQKEMTKQTQLLEKIVEKLSNN